MAEKSIFWTTGATGDGATAYTQAEVIRWMRQLWLADNAEQGVMKGYQNELEPTGATSPIQIDTGAAVVYGFPYWSTAAENVAVATPAANTRIDRIVLRTGWAAQTTRITRIAGVEGVGTPPAITQTDGVTWDLKICQVSITTGGACTLTDERDFARPNIAVDENMLDASVAGDGLSGGDGDALEVNVDDDTIEINSDTLRVKDAGIDEDAINSSIAGDGLSGGSGLALEVSVDDSTIEINSDTLRVKDAGITAAKINNRTRRVFIPVVGAYNHTGAAVLPVSENGVGLSNNTLEECYAFGLIPKDYASGAVIYACLMTDSGAGNVYYDVYAQYGDCGEDFDQHTDSILNQTETSPTLQENLCLGPLTLASEAVDDQLRLRFVWKGTSGSHTYSGVGNFIGFYLEYIADS